MKKINRKIAKVYQSKPEQIKSETVRSGFAELYVETYYSRRAKNPNLFRAYVALRLPYSEARHNVEVARWTPTTPEDRDAIVEEMKSKDFGETIEAIADEFFETHPAWGALSY